MAFHGRSIVVNLMLACIICASSNWILADAKTCPIRFKDLSYSVLINNCKPPYPKDPCCNAFKKFACPYFDYLNDLSNHCADDMFYYINLYGHYSTGLFFDLCLEGPKGLSCPGKV